MENKCTKASCKCMNEKCPNHHCARDDNSVAIPSGTNANGGKEYRMKADTGILFEEAKKLDMNVILELAKANGFVPEPIQLQTSMGVLNVPSWQKDVMRMDFWNCLGIACSWKDSFGVAQDFFDDCLKSGWKKAVEELSKLVENTYGRQS